MKECLVDGERAIVAHDQAPKVPQPADPCARRSNAAYTAARRAHPESAVGFGSCGGARSRQFLVEPAALATGRCRASRRENARSRACGFSKKMCDLLPKKRT